MLLRLARASLCLAGLFLRVCRVLRVVGMLCFLGVLLRFHEVLLQLLLGFPAAAGCVAKLPCGLRSAALNVGSSCSLLGLPCRGIA